MPIQWGGGALPLDGILYEYGKIQKGGTFTELYPLENERQNVVFVNNLYFLTNILKYIFFIYLYEL